MNPWPIRTTQTIMEKSQKSKIFSHRREPETSLSANQNYKNITCFRLIHIKTDHSPINNPMNKTCLNKFMNCKIRLTHTLYSVKETHSQILQYLRKNRLLCSLRKSVMIRNRIKGPKWSKTLWMELFFQKFLKQTWLKQTWLLLQRLRIH